MNERLLRTEDDSSKEEGTLFNQGLKRLPHIKPYPSSANFILIQGKKSLINLKEKLAFRKILVRDCRSFLNLGSNWLRISLQQRSGNKRIFL